MKETGILMPLFSLPSRSGVGELGGETETWLDMLEDAGVAIWQILPLNPAGYGNSPYQPYSSCAGDEIYISLEELYESGLLEERPPAFRQYARRVDYQAVRAFKEPYLRAAFGRFEKTGGFHEFASQDWVEPYCVFRALKKANGGICWNEWTDEAEKNWCGNRTALSEEVQNEADYHAFLQYMFFLQWTKIKERANKKGIRIMGDVPFYVGLDSVDVWSGKDNFLLDADGKPVFIAGVPPDYFSETGQRWGNPIYDWKKMKQDGYRFWTDRIGYNSKLFDIIRIDHFRAFDTFWKIPASCPTAVEGEWIEAPGYEVIDTLRREIPGVDLVAEDLGDLRPEVLALRDHYHLKGMKILMFSIDLDGKYAYDRMPEKENRIIYTGTHDNDTLMEWYRGLAPAKARRLRRFLKKEGLRNGSVQERLLSYVMRSAETYAILPMADVIGLGKEGHLNTPGTVGSPNWEWRMPGFSQAEESFRRCKRTLFQR